MINKEKLQHALDSLGNDSVNSENRHYARSALNAIGYKSADYVNLSNSDLQRYVDAIRSRSPELLPTVAYMTVDLSALDSEPVQPTVQPTVQAPTVAQPTMAQPKPAAPSKPDNKAQDSAATLAASLADMIAKATAQPLDETKIIELIKKYSVAMPTQIQVVENGKVKITVDGLHHAVLPDLIRLMKSDKRPNVLLVGSAGAGKTMMAEQAAKILGVPFYFNGAISSEYKLTGFYDAQGRIVSTAFRNAYENGGVYLFDEMDSSMPDALLAFNAALSNGHMDFPDGSVLRHENFYCLAATNTFGKGADRVYVGRNQLDAASLDRFVMLQVNYDEKLERALASNDTWVDRVIKIRKAADSHKIRHVVSPRASINGASLLRAGFSENEVLDMVIFKGLDADSVNKLKAA